MIQKDHIFGIVQNKVNYCISLILNINVKFLISKNTINILGVTFDSKLQWNDQIATVSNKATKAINAILIVDFRRSNTFNFLNQNKPLSWLNLSLDTFKVNCKRFLLGT